SSVLASGPNPDNISTFAAVRSSDGALTVMVINKQLSTSANVTVNVQHFLPTGSAQVWQLTSANTISRLADLSFSGTSFTNTLPPQSITLFILAAGTPAAPHLTPGTNVTSSSFSFWLEGQAGQRYAIQASSDLLNWQPMQTNALLSAATNLTFST